MKLALISFACLTTLSCNALYAEDSTRYVRDWMSVPLHETVNADSKTVHPGLASGTELTLLQSDEKSGFARVRTSEGVEGWIATRYLMSNPTARMQLDRANGELAELRKQTADLKAQQENIPRSERDAAQQLMQLKTENQQLQTELQALQQAPDGAAQLAQENIELKKDNESLRAELEGTKTEIAQQQRSNNFAQFREGGIAVIAGALLALLAANLWPKKKSEWS